MTLGERIRTARKGKYTQEELAEMIGVHVNTLRRWERGERSPDAKIIPILAEKLGVSVSELMEDDEMVTSGENFKKMPTPVSRSNKWMLVYERDGERLELPPTDQGYSIMTNIANAMATRSSGAVSQTTSNFAIAR